MVRVALVTADPESITYGDPDMEPLVDGLRRAGVSAVPAVWCDPSVAWESFALAVMRSPWDYSDRAAEFQQWLGDVAATTSVLNCAETIRWNLDKRYLGELAGEGIAVVPTTYCVDIDQVGRAIVAAGAAQVVVKPTVSAGSRDTGRFDAGDGGAEALAVRILAQGKAVMVQPFVETVAELGETALVYFDGRFSHGVVKGPILDTGGRLISRHHREAIRACEPGAHMRDIADVAMERIPRLLRTHGCCCDAAPLYARIDLVEGGDGPLVLEAELFEPAYFVGTAKGAEARFAEAVASRLGVVRPHR